jgi:hypothetical protein
MADISQSKPEKSPHDQTGNPLVLCLQQFSSVNHGNYQPPYNDEITDVKYRFGPDT